MTLLRGALDRLQPHPRCNAPTLHGGQNKKAAQGAAFENLIRWITCGGAKPAKSDRRTAAKSPCLVRELR